MVDLTRIPEHLKKEIEVLYENRERTKLKALVYYKFINKYLIENMEYSFIRSLYK